jgi:dTDP-4-dehydrorhamnose reductase
LTGLYHLVNDEKITKFELVSIFNEVFSCKKTIVPYNDYFVDKSLVNCRNDFNYKVKSYEQMVTEMKDWIKLNQNIYPNYLFQ